MNEKIEAMQNGLKFIKSEKDNLIKSRAEIGKRLTELTKLERINKEILKILRKEDGKSK